MHLYNMEKVGIYNFFRLGGINRERVRNYYQFLSSDKNRIPSFFFAWNIYIFDREEILWLIIVRI